MNDDQLRTLALIHMIQAKIEVMKADNDIASNEGNPPMWTSDDFEEATNDLDRAISSY